MDIPITFITSFKKFKGELDAIQSSALYSWAAAGVSLVTLCNEVGLRERISDYPGVKIVSGVRLGRDLGFQTNAPVIPDLIRAALPEVKTQMVGFICSDLILSPDFADRFEKLIRTRGYDVFLTGSRGSVTLSKPVDCPVEHEALWATPPTATGLAGLFIASRVNFRRMLQTLPAFLMGRPNWSSWMRWWGETQSGKMVESTELLPVYHCVHGYQMACLQEGVKDFYETPASKYNRGLWK